MKIQRRHVVLASLVLALGVAVYVNWQLTPTEEVNSTKELGKATYVNSNVSATADESDIELSSNLSKEQQNYFSNARLKRDKTADEVKEIALEALSLTESDEDAKEKALAQLAALEKQLMNQTSVENILVAKGFSQCVCSLGEDSVTVIVAENEMTDKSSLIIKDAVTEICSVPFENISVVTV